MGHYDNLRGGADPHGSRLRRQAYEKKMRAQAWKEISDEQVREYLRELDGCPRPRCMISEHAKNVVYDDEDFKVAQQVVDRGLADSVYDVLDTDTKTRALRKLCRRARLVQGSRITDEGREVMNGDSFDRPEISWDEERAQEWYKHD